MQYVYLYHGTVDVHLPSHRFIAIAGSDQRYYTEEPINHPDFELIDSDEPQKRKSKQPRGDSQEATEEQPVENV